MAWFGKKKSDDDANGSSGPGGDGSFQAQPEAARPWFDRARIAADTHQYEYAMTLYLSGIKFDPTNMQAHERLLETANLYRAKGGKPGASRELRSLLSGRAPVDRLVAAELAWVSEGADAGLALKMAQQAVELGLSDLAIWVGNIGVGAALRSGKKPKNLLASFLDIYEEVGAFEDAVQLGDQILAMDRTDGILVARIRNLSAKATMEKGKYDQKIGVEGGFRGSVRDLDSQKAILDDEAMASGEDVASRRLERARQDLTANPDDLAMTFRFADLLRKEGRDETDREAIEVLNKGYQKTGEYRFRMLAGDTRLTMKRRNLRAMRAKAEASGDAAELSRVDHAERDLQKLTATELKDRVTKYPTDLELKYTLGETLYQVGEFEEAINWLQSALMDGRFKARCQHLIGLCFLKTNWYDEAVESLRAAVEIYAIKDDETHLGMRYDLMEALEAYAKEHRSLEAAEEAGRLASGIAMKQLNFRDVKARRDALRELVRELRGGVAR